MHRGLHRDAGEVEAGLARHFGEAQGIGRRAAEHAGADVAHQLEALRRIAPAAGNHQRAELARALGGGPEADEGAEGEGHEDAVGGGDAGAGQDVAPAAAPPLPAGLGVGHLERHAGCAGSLVEAHVLLERIGEVVAEGAVGGLVLHQLVLGGERQFGQIGERADVARLGTGGLPFVGIEAVPAPQLAAHRLELLKLQRGELLARQGLGA